MRCTLLFCLSFGDRYYPFLPPCPWLVGISLELGFGRATTILQPCTESVLLSSSTAGDSNSPHALQILQLGVYPRYLLCSSGWTQQRFSQTWAVRY